MRVAVMVLGVAVLVAGAYALARAETQAGFAVASLVTIAGGVTAGVAGAVRS